MLHRYTMHSIQLTGSDSAGKRMKIKKFIYLIAIITVCISLKSHAEEDCKVFVVLTTADVQTQLMALVLTTQMSKHGEVDQILLCGPAGDLAVKNSRETLLKPINKSPQMLLQSLIENGGACKSVRCTCQTRA